ncbi:putative membrane protein [Bradyrhizobium sp. i1.8.4]|uniref:hypothetical protein n=1 Tax=unclassified Bradyrhizobium TaxID=2631580 RepID=UPI003D235FAE
MSATEALAIIIFVCLLAAWVIFDLVRTFKTGRARSRHGTAKRGHQPVRFWCYVLAEFFVLAFCFVMFCLAAFWPDIFR